MKYFATILLAILLLIIAGYSSCQLKDSGWLRHEIGRDEIIVQSHIDKNIDFTSNSSDCFNRENIQFEWIGFFQVQIPGEYSFSTTSDDGSELWIDGKMVVDNSGHHVAITKYGKVWLAPGDHKIQVKYFNGGGESVIRVEYLLGVQWVLLGSDRISFLPHCILGRSMLFFDLHSVFYYFASLIVAIAIVFSWTIFPKNDKYNNRDVALFVITFIIGLFVLFSPRIASDGYGYFSYLRSLVFDSDFCFANEFSYTGEGFEYSLGFLVEENILSKTGCLVNYWSIGPACIWSLFYLVSLGVSSVSVQLGICDSVDGFSLFQVVAIGFGSAFCGLLCVLTSYCSSKKFYTAGNNAFPLVVVFAGTPLFYYSFYETSFAHAAAAFSVSLYVYIWLNGRDEKGCFSWLKLGMSGGLMVLMYWQNALLLTMGFGDLFVRLYLAIVKRISDKKVWSNLGAYAIGLIFVVSPQLIAWKIIYGHYLFIPQGKDFVLGLSRHLDELFLSPYHGLFTWTPIIMICLFGFLFFLPARIGRSWIFMLMGLLLFIGHNSMMHDWYAGGGFGGRRFTNVFVIFFLGYMAIWERYKHSIILKIVSQLSVIWTLLLIASYRLGKIGIPRTMRELFLSLSGITLENIFGFYIKSALIVKCLARDDMYIKKMLLLLLYATLIFLFLFIMRIFRFDLCSKK